MSFSAVSSATMLCVGVVLWGTSAIAQPSVERCAGTVCLRDRRLTEDAFVERYGPGMLVTDPDEPRLHRHCFFLGVSSHSALFTFDRASTQRKAELVSILLSDVELCPIRVLPKRDLGRIATERGIAIGNRRDEIERALGRPHRTDRVETSAENGLNARADINYSPRLGRTRLVYEIEQDTLFNFFYLGETGRLSSVLLDDSP